MNREEITQFGISGVNAKMDDVDFKVYSYIKLHGKDLIVTLVNSIGKKQQITIPKDELPHASAIIAFVRHPNEMSKLIKEKIRGSM